MTKLVTEHECPHRADGVYKKRMGAIERVDKATPFYVCPAARLDGSRNLDSECVKVFLPGVVFNFSFLHQAEQVAVGAHIIEAMVVYASMADMGCHPLQRFISSQF